jgi:adenylate cyclase
LLSLLHLGHDFGAASGAVARAVALNGSCATAFYFGAHIHAMGGDAATAEDFAERALRLSPFDQFSYFALLAIGTVRLRNGRFDDAASYYSKAVQANPRFSVLYALHTSALAQAGRVDEARLVVSRLLALDPNFRVQPFKAGFSHFHPDLIESVSAGLRKAGLPE